MNYKFWSVWDGYSWKCIPPSSKYVPEDYSKGALVKKHEEILPPPSYWLFGSYERMVYEGSY